MFDTEIKLVTYLNTSSNVFKLQYDVLYSKVLHTDKSNEFRCVTVSNCCLIVFNIASIGLFLETINFGENSFFKHKSSSIAETT